MCTLVRTMRVQYRHVCGLAGGETDHMPPEVEVAQTTSLLMSRQPWLRTRPNCRRWHKIRPQMDIMGSQGLARYKGMVWCTQLWRENEQDSASPGRWDPPSRNDGWRGQVSERHAEAMCRPVWKAHTLHWRMRTLCERVTAGHHCTLDRWRRALLGSLSAAWWRQPKAASSLKLLR